MRFALPYGVAAALCCIACASAVAAAGSASVAAVDGDPSYTAAVVEYVYAAQPSVGPNGCDRPQAVAYMHQNLDAYESLLHNATAGQQSQGLPAAQIMVFPEYGVLGWPAPAAGGWTRDNVLPFLEPVPEPGSAVAANPCALADPDTQPITRRLSCLAAQYGVVIVADYGDVSACDPKTTGCPADGRLQYNTAVAFGADGTLRARYHKCHLFGAEVWYFDAANATTPGVACPHALFRADFGVDFELLICYDIMFTGPAAAVRHTAFPTFWVNDLHPPNATEEQQRWTAEYAPHTLLAANIGVEGWRSSGSGVWRDGQALAEFVNTTPGPMQQMLVATVPATPASAAAEAHAHAAVAAAAAGVHTHSHNEHARG